MIQFSTQLIAGSHCWVALEGRALSRPTDALIPVGSPINPALVGRDAKPSKDDTAWHKLGIIDTARWKTGNMQPITVHDSAPGHLVVANKIALGQERVLTVKCLEVQPETVQLMFATAPLDGTSTQFNPDEGKSGVNLWVKFQAFDHEDKLLLTLDQWGFMMIPDDLEFSNKALTAVSYEIHCIRAALNTGA